MPLTAGQYNGLSATLDIDYHRGDAVPDANTYRLGETPNAPMDTGPGDFNRGPFSVASNYKIGWIGPDQWYNYTRTFPAGDYEIFAALSFDVSPGSGNADAPDRLSGNVQLVTAGATTVNQTVQNIGTFTAPGTGGWGVNRLVQALASDGRPATVSLSGDQTIRYNAVSGDFDYLELVKVEGGLPQITVSKSGTTLHITWTNGGSLQASPALSGPNLNWQVVDSDGTYDPPITGPAMYFRVLK